MWIFSFVLSAIIIFIAYLVTSCIILAPEGEKFIIPKSLSDTYYMYKEKYNIGWIFSLVLTIVVALLTPAWLEATQGSNWQFLGFLTPVSLLFVAFSPAFKEDLEGTVHTVSAILCAVLAILWCILFDYCYIVALAITIILFILTLEYKKYKALPNIVFWLEMAAFGALLSSLFIYITNYIFIN